MKWQMTPSSVSLLSLRSHSRPADPLVDLTGSAPTPNNDTLSGASHSLSLKTAYYEADVPIWIDTINPTSPSQWSGDFLMEEANEVLQALGGYVLSFPRPVTEEEKGRLRDVVKEVGRVIKSAERKGWDGVCVLVLMGQDVVPQLEFDQAAMEDWEDWGVEHGGWEVVDGEAKAGAKNDFGEKAGWERVREALEANNWEGGADDDDPEDLGLDLEGFEDGEVSDEMRKEMEGMKQAIYGGAEDDGDEEKDVEKMEVLMRKMQTMRGMFYDHENGGSG